jgi:hypothetical protein
MTATSLTRRLLQGLRRVRRAPGARPDLGDCGAELALDLALAPRALAPARAAGPERAHGDEAAPPSRPPLPAA